jgi:uncharacterized membrane protein YhaH (DUF805 family)
MERASKVMYSIANFFTWILVFLSIAGITFSILSIVGNVLPKDFDTSYLGIGSLVYFIVILIVGLITIAMVRRAKTNGTSKAWDVLFFVLGILGGNIFYILGGIFGIVARR